MITTNYLAVVPAGVVEFQAVKDLGVGAVIPGQVAVTGELLLLLQQLHARAHGAGRQDHLPTPTRLCHDKGITCQPQQDFVTTRGLPANPNKTLSHFAIASSS